MNLTKLIADYVREQWLNFKRAINEPQGREELLSGASISFYEPGTTKPMATYMDADLHIAHPDQVVANSSGEFHPIYFDMSKKISATLRKADGELVMSVDDARELAGPSCPHCGKPLGTTHSASSNTSGDA